MLQRRLTMRVNPLALLPGFVVTLAATAILSWIFLSGVIMTGNFLPPLLVVAALVVLSVLLYTRAGLDAAARGLRDVESDLARRARGAVRKALRLWWGLLAVPFVAIVAILLAQPTWTTLWTFPNILIWLFLLFTVFAMLPMYSALVLAESIAWTRGQSQQPPPSQG